MDALFSSRSLIATCIKLSDTVIESTTFEIIPYRLVLLFLALGCNGSGHLVCYNLKSSFEVVNPYIHFVGLLMEDIPLIYK
jgi:hypothetical protein